MSPSSADCAELKASGVFADFSAELGVAPPRFLRCTLRTWGDSSAAKLGGGRFLGDTAAVAKAASGGRADEVRTRPRRLCRALAAPTKFFTERVSSPSSDMTPGPSSHMTAGLTGEAKLRGYRPALVSKTGCGKGLRTKHRNTITYIAHDDTPTTLGTQSAPGHNFTR